MPQDFSIQIGFDAIAVSLLGANSPIGILPAGLLLGGLLQGSSLMQFSTGVQGPFVEVLEALVILFVVAVPFLLNRLLRRWRAGTGAATLALPGSVVADSTEVAGRRQL